MVAGRTGGVADGAADCDRDSDSDRDGGGGAGGVRAAVAAAGGDSRRRRLQAAAADASPTRRRPDRRGCAPRGHRRRRVRPRPLPRGDRDGTGGGGRVCSPAAAHAAAAGTACHARGRGSRARGRRWRPRWRQRWGWWRLRGGYWRAGWGTGGKRSVAAVSRFFFLLAAPEMPRRAGLPPAYCRWWRRCRPPSARHLEVAVGGRSPRRWRRRPRAGGSSVRRSGTGRGKPVMVIPRYVAAAERSSGRDDGVGGGVRCGRATGHGRARRAVVFFTFFLTHAPSAPTRTRCAVGKLAGKPPPPSVPRRPCRR